MPFNPLISVIIPVYNVEEYLERSVESVLSQSHKNTEVIIVDDGSKDGSDKVADALSEKYPNVTVIHKENGGVARARVTGGNAAKGDYVFFLDADDWMPDGALEALVNDSDGGKVDLISGTFSPTDRDYVFGECPIDCEFHKKYGADFIKEKLIKGDGVGVLGVHIDAVAAYLKNSFNKPGNRYVSHVNLWNVLYKRSLVEKANKTDLDFVFALKRKEDTLYKAVLYSFAESIVFTDAKVYVYFNRPNSEMRRDISFAEAAKIRYTYYRSKKEFVDKYMDGGKEENYKCFLGSVILAYISAIIESHDYDKKAFKFYRNEELTAAACKYYRGKGVPKKYRILLFCYKRKLYFVFWLFSKFEKKMFKWKQ